MPGLTQFILPARLRRRSRCLGTAAVLLAIPLWISSPALAETAAESDWQAVTDAGQCQGRYVSEPIEQAIPDGPVKASARSILHVSEHSTTMVGDIRINADGKVLSADFATIDTATEIYHAEGDVALRQQDILLRGSQVSGNLFKDTAAIDSATFLMHQQRLRGRAARIEQHADGELAITTGSFTTCEPGDNAWSVNGEEIVLKPAAGYGTARDMTLRIKDVPVAYFPYFRFPIDESRQSGFLWPAVGQESRGGTDIALPYYFNLAPDYDATYTLRSISRRGIMHEGEVRYLNGYSNNTVAATFLPDDKEYDGRQTIDASRPDDFDEQDRWLGHISHRGAAGPWASIINYTSVSDIDYFEDLGGFTATDSDFDQALDQSDAPALVRRGSLSYTRENWQSRLALRSFQTLNQIQPAQFETLPQFTLTGQQQFMALQTSGVLQATMFESPDGIRPEGTRLVADAEASLPMTTGWGYITPRYRVVFRDYSLDRTLAGGREDVSLTTNLFSIDSGITLEKDTTLFGQATIQTLEPRLNYLYAEDDFQADLPFFDSTRLTPSFDDLFRDNRYAGYDRIGDANRLSIGLTSRWYRQTNSQEILSLSLGQAIYFEDREVNAGEFAGNAADATTSPLFLAMETRIAQWRFRATYEHNTDENRSNRGYLSAQYRHADVGIFNFNYAMTANDQQRGIRPRQRQETDLSFFLPIGDSGVWRAIGRWNYGLETSQTIESLLGLEYNNCCWAARIVYRRHLEEPRVVAITNPGSPTVIAIDNRADSGLFFEFQLKGLASLGGRMDNLLRNSIPGFRTER